MSRELLHPLFVGAIMTWVVMAFFISIPPFILITVMLFVSLIYFITRREGLRYISILLITLLIATIAQLRVSYKEREKFLPLDNRSFNKADVVVSNDLISIKGGFIGSGEIVRVYSGQFIIDAKYPVTVYSTKELITGEFISMGEITFRDNKLFCKVTKEDVIVDTGFLRIRKKVILALKTYIKSPLLLALITGNKSRLDSYIVERFRESGCSHILALSGFHVGVVVIIVMLLLKVIFTGNKIYVFSVFILIIYVLVVGITPSLLRSIIMFIVAVIFRLRSIRVPTIRILTFSFHIMLLLNPDDFYSLSFKLSFLALWGILTVGKELSYLPIIRSLPALLKFSICASISALILTSFISYPEFGKIYPVGILAALILTPIVTLFMWTGLLSILIKPLNNLLLLIEEAIYFLTEFFSKFPVIDESTLFSNQITLILLIIPVILLILKTYRRLNAGRFNTTAKL